MDRFSKGGKKWVGFIPLKKCFLLLGWNFKDNFFFPTIAKKFLNIGYFWGNDKKNKNFKQKKLNLRKSKEETKPGRSW